MSLAIQRLLIPLAIGSIALAVISVATIYSSTPGWISRIEPIILAKQLAAFQTRVKTRTAVVNESLAGVRRDAETAGRFAAEIAGWGDAGMTIARPYQSYFGAQVNNVDPPIPPIAQQPLFSYYYNNAVTSPDQLATAGADNFTVLDNAFRAVYLNKPGYQAIQAGFADGGWRFYPYSYDMARFNPRTQVTCNVTYAPPPLQSTIGYDPRCRIWYVQALQAAQSRTSANPPGLGPAVISTPYKSGASTGRVLITASQAFLSPTTNAVQGVIGLQVAIDTLRTQLTRSPILSNGYLFIVDSSGTLVVYPESKTKVDIYANPTGIAQVEFDGDASSAAAFMKVVKDLAADAAKGNVRVDRVKKRGEDWVVAASAVAGTDFYVITTVPDSDILFLTTQMRDRTRLFGIISITTVCLLLALSTFLSIHLSRLLAARILTPIAELTNVLDRIGKKELSVELESGEYDVAPELRVINEHFRNLLVAVRFGNEAYYKNDLGKALENYEAAEKMMIQFKNERGRGVCLNNKGNTYKQMGTHTFKEALEAYTNAIAN
ncbi:hypothetical protein HK104_003261, partial [Borealophlyctis nickersoniae]